MNLFFDNVFVALLCLCFGLFAAWCGWRDLQHSHASTTWPSTSGEIIGSAVQTRSNGEDTFHRTVITYRYHVAGTAYMAKRVFFGGELALQFSGPGKRCLTRYPIGRQVAVAYNPAAPEEAVLEPGPNEAAYLSLIVPVALVLFGAIKLLGLV